MKSDVLGPEAFEPSFSRNVMSAWEKFLVCGMSGHPAVRSVIQESWVRCREEHVSPCEQKAPLLAVGDELLGLQSRHADLLRATREVTATLEAVLERSQSILLVSNAQGVVIDVVGNGATREVAAERHIAPGGCWGEDMSGTNAVGTAIAIGAPVQVHAVEHYCEIGKQWTCSAALVRTDGQSDILGVIDITGADETFNTHSLALAISVANQVKALLHGWEAHDRIKLLQWCSEEASSWKNDGLIVLDARGRVVSSNKSAPDALRHSGIALPLISGRPLPGAPMRSDSLPDWVQADWVQAVEVDGKNLGKVIVLPHREPTAVRSVERLRAKIERSNDLMGARIIGESEAIRAAVDRAMRLAAGSFPVLILGETGVGKEEFAHAIHDASAVRDGPFVALNCGALARDLVASELFGYADGAFTGARKGGRAGKFEDAHGGTLFLDEIGELPLDVQAHLLRVLQDGLVTRIGDNRAHKVSVRILSATHRDLRSDITHGRFREDLYYRLAATTLALPPLRARKSDIALLCEHFMEQLFEKYGGTQRIAGPGLYEALNDYSWPGNIRELRNTLEAMWHLCDGEVILPKDLPAECRNTGTHHAEEKDPDCVVTGLRATERETIVKAIARNNGNMCKTARELGIARSTLYEKVKAHEISIKSSAH